MRIKIFGPPAVWRDKELVGGALAQRRRLALVAVLAAGAPPGQPGISRERLLALLWPGDDEGRARAALSQALYAVRREFDTDDAIVGTSDLRLNPQRVTCDYWDFQQALSDGADSLAADLRTGPLLEGLDIPDARDLEFWLEEKRMATDRQWTRAVERVALVATKTGQREEAVRWRRVLANADPLSGRTAMALAEALESAGEREAALRHLRVHSALVRQELETAPSPEVEALIEALVHTPGTARREPAMSAAVPLMVERLASSEDETSTPVGGATKAQTATRIAVVPFSNLSTDAENGYFADGLTEEVILSLRKVKTLQVVSPTTVMPFRQRGVALGEMAHALEVTHLLEGSVRKAGDRVRVTATLLDASRDVSLWSERFDGTLADVFAMQDRVAAAILASLSITLSREEMAQVAAHPLRDPVAYDLYLRAREGINAFTPAGLERAFRHLAAAQEVAPDNVFLLRQEARAAWAAINHGITADWHLLDRALAIADRIAEIDPASPFVPELRGLVYSAKGDVAVALQHLSLAFEAMPKDVDIVFWYGSLLTFFGNPEVGLPVLEEACRLEPALPLAPLVPLARAAVFGAFEVAFARFDAIVDPSLETIVYLCHAMVGLAAGDRGYARRAAVRSAAGPAGPFRELAELVVRALDDTAAGSFVLSPSARDIMWADRQYAEIVALAFVAQGDLREAAHWLMRSAELGSGNARPLREYNALLRPHLGDPAIAAAMTRLEDNARRYAVIPVAPRALQLAKASVSKP